MGDRSTSRVRVVVAGRELTVSNLDKVLYPASGTPKAALVKYAADIAPTMLPHLAGRPVTLVRAPDGVEGPRFFEKRCPASKPAWVRAGGPQQGALVEEAATLVWLANLAALELHVHQHTVDAPSSATAVVFDLDPGPGCDILDCAPIATALRDLLAPLDLDVFAKTSGSKGLHCCVPVDPDVTTAEAAKAFARTVGTALAKHRPDAITVSMKTTDRPGRVFIDWSQNDAAKTTVAPYSTRVRPRPTVSTPVTWDELDDAMTRDEADRLSFEIGEVPGRVADRGDLWSAVLRSDRQLPGV